MTGEKEAVQRGHGVTHLSRLKKGTVLIPGGSSCSLGDVMNKLLFHTPESFSNSRSITETDHHGPDGPSAAVGPLGVSIKTNVSRLRKLPEKFNDEDDVLVNITTGFCNN